MSKEKKHRYFDPKMKGRAWVVTMHISVLKKIGFTEEEINQIKADVEMQKNMAERVEEYIKSALDADVAIVICVSAEGLFHLHIALYTKNSTTLKHVADCLLGSHVEPQLAKKEGLLAYLKKTGEYEEKGEIVLYEYNLESVQDGRSSKNGKADINNIQLMINAGATPNEIFEKNFLYRKYSKMIMDAYISKKTKDAPLHKDMHCEWHFGNSGCGKSYTYIKLCEEYGRENIYFMNDFQNGGLDLYIERGCPSILFLDEVKPGDVTYRQLLMLTDAYSDAQTHSRFHNALNLWNQVYVTSIYSPEQFYHELVSEDKRNVETFEQLKRRFNSVIYHYIHDDNYLVYEKKMNQYTNGNAMILEAYNRKSIEEIMGVKL